MKTAQPVPKKTSLPSYHAIRATLTEAEVGLKKQRKATEITRG